MFKRRAITNLLVLAALVAALGTDYLAQAGGAVRVEAMVNVAERMAVRFSHACDRQTQRPTVVHLNADRRAVCDASPRLGGQPQRIEHGSDLQPHLLRLPPPFCA